MLNLAWSIALTMLLSILSLPLRTLAGSLLLDIYTEPLRAHLPLYSAMPSFEKLPKELARSLFRIIDNYETEDRSTRLGFACEIGSSMICNGMGRFGLKSYPAFLRQDNGNRAEPNKSFDLMVESDGSVIETGRYPVQVKASKSSSKGRYHPLITRVNFDRLTECDFTNLQESMGDLALKCLVTHGAREQFRLHAPEQISERMLEALEKTGPLDQQMLLTEPAGSR